MQTLEATSVSAKGAFGRATEDEVIVAFRYLFRENPGAELIVYLSDDPDVGEDPEQPDGLMDLYIFYFQGLFSSRSDLDEPRPDFRSFRLMQDGASKRGIAVEMKKSRGAYGRVTLLCLGPRALEDADDVEYHGGRNALNVTIFSVIPARQR